MMLHEPFQDILRTTMLAHKALIHDHFFNQIAQNGVELFLDRVRSLCFFGSSTQQRSSAMNPLIDALASLLTAPLGGLLALVALAAIGLAVFAIYVVYSTINDRERR
jgi:hypothetical protein